MSHKGPNNVLALSCLAIPVCCPWVGGQNLMIFQTDCSVDEVIYEKKNTRKIISCALIDHCELFLSLSAFEFKTKQ